MENEKKVFVDKIYMETQTVFSEDGTIAVHPCPFELGQQVLANSGRQVRQKGSMVTSYDGTSHFRPYRKDSGRRYVELWGDPYTVLKMSKTRLVLTVNVPLDLDDPYGELSDWAKGALKGYTTRNVEESIHEAHLDYINQKTRR